MALLVAGLTVGGGAAYAVGPATPAVAVEQAVYHPTAKNLTAGTPKITGTAKVGSKLTASPGKWTKGTSLTYQWYASGAKIVGATKSTHTIKAAQHGERIVVKVTGTKTGFKSVTRTSAKTSTVAASWALKEYGKFTSFTRSGTGDDVIKLPKGTKAAIIKATHSGDSNFIIQGLDADGDFAGLPVNEIGTYSGTTAVGLSKYERGETKYLEIIADGRWKLVVSPVADAPTMKSSSSGDGVFLYSTTSLKKAKITHKGSSNFAVMYHRAGTWDLLVNEIGRYSGTKTIKAGPGVMEVVADGKWTFKR
ncbi:MAG: hypothetical protein P0Y48_08645 [Candidatus Microbacterium phytovorans]|uniref:Uncharacterized protein n=1 Tax=Candidatus Microbacterium phytovorans TaxID=3121374 RepID=A0AAJ6B277_9MICO|nr:hypothetical protein [Microbacterium sp.]WEK12545.1 MAG: hypothetical protein P0Y48_08645 [Microbacterium sp.]